jgi:hypothetical protein
VDVTVAGREPFGDRRWERTWGTVFGAASPDDGVVGLSGLHEWSSEFEVIGPTADTGHDAILVDVENRGGRSVFDVVAPEVTRGEVAYARVQWQTGHAAGVPDAAQGVGDVILRDFGRWLASRFPVRVLAGASQSAWCVNTFVGEGFNQDPDGAGPVYAGAFAYLSGGNWLAVNRWGDDGEPQAPYARPYGARGRPADPPRRRPVPGRDLELHGLRPPPGQPIRHRAAPAAGASLRLPEPPRAGYGGAARSRVRDAGLQRRARRTDEPDRCRALGPRHPARVVP